MGWGIKRLAGYNSKRLGSSFYTYEYPILPVKLSDDKMGKKHLINGQKKLVILNIKRQREFAS